MPADYGSPQFGIVAWILVLWCGLCLWIIWKRSAKFTIWKLLIMMTGCAVLSTLAAPPAQDYLWTMANGGKRDLLTLCVFASWAAAVIVVFRLARDG
jgi:hypothetical protein